MKIEREIVIRGTHVVEVAEGTDPATAPIGTVNALVMSAGAVTNLAVSEGEAYEAFVFQKHNQPLPEALKAKETNSNKTTPEVTPVNTTNSEPKSNEPTPATATTGQISNARLPGEITSSTTLMAETPLEAPKPAESKIDEQARMPDGRHALATEDAVNMHHGEYPDPHQLAPRQSGVAESAPGDFSANNPVQLGVADEASTTTNHAQTVKGDVAKVEVKPGEGDNSASVTTANAE